MAQSPTAARPHPIGQESGARTIIAPQGQRLCDPSPSTATRPPSRHGSMALPARNNPLEDLESAAQSAMLFAAGRADRLSRRAEEKLKNARRSLVLLAAVLIVSAVGVIGWGLPFVTLRFMNEASLQA